jgi:hypothetical protein
MAFQTVSLRSVMNRIAQLIAVAVVGCGLFGFTPARLRFDVAVGISEDGEKAITAIEQTLVALGGIRDSSPGGDDSWYVVPGTVWGAAGEAFLRLKLLSPDTVLVKVDLGPFRTGCSHPDVKTPAMTFVQTIVERSSKKSGISMHIKPEQSRK